MWNRKITTLSFEGNVVNILVAKKQEILYWEHLTFPQEVMNQGQALDPAAVGAALKGVIDREGLPRGRVISSVSGIRSLSRILTLPKLKQKLLNSTVRHKVRQEIAVELNEIDLTWDIVEEFEEQLRVFFIVMPREIPDGLMRCLRVAKLRPRTMEIKPLSLVRCVNQPQALIVNLEPHSLGVIIVVKGIPEMIRTAPLDPLSTSTEEALDQLSREFDRTLKFYNQSHKENRLSEDTPLYTTGSAFDDPQLFNHFSGLVRNPSHIPLPPINLPESFPLGQFCVNVGLALKAS